MSENEEGIQQLAGFLRKKFPKLNNSEIEKIAPNLYSLGLFLVHLKIARLSKQAKTPNAGSPEHITEKPP